MPALHTLSLALAAACLAGVNLYLTLFLAGLAGQLGWLPVTGDSSVIGMLATPAVMTVTLLLYVLNAIVDKVPAVDSLWDTLHTVIRPAGAVLLALHLMGSADPACQALAGILAGAAGLTTHLAKTSTRLLINNAPGPMLNILASITEDLLVFGLGVLAVKHPFASLIVSLSLTALLWLLFPRLFRTGRASLILMWRKVRLPAGTMSKRVKLSAKISADQDMLMHGLLPGACTVSWAVRTVTGRVKRAPGLSQNMFGTLVSVEEHTGTLVFIGRRWFRHRPVPIDLTGSDIRHESAFLSENLVIYCKADRRQITFRFTRAEEALAAKLEEELHRQLKRAGKLPVPAAEALPAETPGPASEPEPAPSTAAFTALPALAPLIIEAPEPAPLAPPASEAAVIPEPAVIPAFPRAADITETVSHPPLMPLPPVADVPPMPLLESAPGAPKDPLA